MCFWDHRDWQFILNMVHRCILNSAQILSYFSPRWIFLCIKTKIMDNILQKITLNKREIHGLNMYCCPFSLGQLLFMSRKKPALCVHLVIGYGMPVWSKVSWLAVLMKLPCTAAHKAQLLLNSPCSPPSPSVICFAAVWGRVSCLPLPGFLSRGLTSSLRMQKAAWNFAPKDDWPFR